MAIHHKSIHHIAEEEYLLHHYEWGDFLIDDSDKIRALVDPTSAYAKNAAAAMNRAMDDVIITAMNASASTGVLVHITALPSTQKFATSNQSDGLTIAKLLAAKKNFDDNSIDPSRKRYLSFVVLQQISDLLLGNNSSYKLLTLIQLESFIQPWRSKFILREFDLLCLNRLPRCN